MINRFEGPDGERNVITVLESSALIEHNKVFAGRLANQGQVLAFDVGETLVSQAASDNDIYFILTGQVDILVNNRHVAIRETDVGKAFMV